MSILNIYGDSGQEEIGGYGIDISTQRTDSLDIAMLRWVDSIGPQALRVVDLGCGKGGQAIRLAALGCEVMAVDIQDFSKQIAETLQEKKLPRESVRFIKSDIRHTPEYLTGLYNLVYSQRTFHYIDYKDAQKLLKRIGRHFVKDQSSRLFISVSGIDSELGENYADRNKPIKYRFCHLDKKMQHKHKILLPVCLYSLKELEKLLLDCNYEIEKIYQSEFGNIKAIAWPK